MLLGLSVGALLLITLIGVAILAFEIWMFIEVLKNTQLPDTDRLLWAGGMLLIHPFVAILYYFTAYQKQRRS